jgi:hypothetical protein
LTPTEKRVAIVQSNYIPWKGYFDLIAAVDEFILYDDMQYTRRDWRNRNQIKTPHGLQWLTVPVEVKGKYHQRIRDTKIDGDDWAGLHWKSLVQNYRKASCFGEVASWLKPYYQEKRYTHLSALNRDLIVAVCSYLGIGTRITDSCDYRLGEGKAERLADLCVQASATEYLSGPAARDYIDPAIFEARGVRLTWFDYVGYPSYPQLWGDFRHEVTILDLLFNCGQEAPRFMRYASARQDLQRTRA